MHRENPPHVLLSYHQDVLPLVLRIAASLKAEGYNVWFYLEQLKGSNGMLFARTFSVHYLCQ